MTYQHLNIAYLEMLNILVALNVWHKEWAGLKVQVQCDNQAVVSVLSNGRSHAPVLAEYARNIFLWISALNIDLKVVHVSGKLNKLAGLLSKWFITNNNFRSCSNWLIRLCGFLCQMLCYIHDKPIKVSLTICITYHCCYFQKPGHLNYTLLGEQHPGCHILLLTPLRRSMLPCSERLWPSWSSCIGTFSR